MESCAARLVSRRRAVQEELLTQMSGKRVSIMEEEKQESAEYATRVVLEELSASMAEDELKRQRKAT